jgi:hypothetical protein
MLLGLTGIGLAGCGGGDSADAEAAKRLGESAHTVSITPTQTGAKAKAQGSFACDSGSGQQCDLVFSKPGSAPNASKHENSITVDFSPDGGDLTGKLTAALTMSDGNCDFTADADLTGKFDAVTRFFNGGGTLKTTKTGTCGGAAGQDGAVTWTGSLGSDGKSVSGQLKQGTAAFPFVLAVGE